MLLGSSIRERSWLVSTLSQSGPPGIRARHGPRIRGGIRARRGCAPPTPASTLLPRRSIGDLRRRAETRMTSTDIPAIDEAGLEAFVGQAVVDMA